MNLNILYEDNHVIVVEKIVGVLSQADHTNDSDMLTLIKDYIKDKYNKPGNVYLGLIHRLDRMVGGIMVFAKTSKAASRLSDQVRTRKIEKKYLAVVHGTPDSGTLQNYLKKDTHRNKVFIVGADINGSKHAELTFRKLETSKDLSLVDINLKTGRPHQIRVQFSHIGHPLYGDKKYGDAKDKADIALYAYQLSFFHPVKKDKLTFRLFPTNFPFNIFTINL